MTRALLGNRNFLLLWQGQFVSQLGSQAFFIAMMFWATQATGSAAQVGLLMMLYTIPTVVLAPLGGVIADRHSRRNVLIVADALSGALVAVPGIAMLSGEVPAPVLFALVGIAALGIGSLNAFFQPALSAAIPDIVPENHVVPANSAIQLNRQVTTFAGQAAGGLLYGLIGAPLLFLFDAASYLLSAVSETFIRLPARTATGSAFSYRRFGQEIRAGFDFVWQRPGMRLLLLLATAFNFLLAPVFVLLPFYVTGTLGEAAFTYGAMVASLSLGAILGSLFAGAMNAHGRRRVLLVNGGMLAAALAMACLALAGNSIAAGALLLLAGASSGLVNILVFALFQSATPADIRGRVMSVVITLSGGMAPLGMFVGGILGELSGNNAPPVYAACGLSAAVLVMLVMNRASWRRFLSGTEIPVA